MKMMTKNIMIFGNILKKNIQRRKLRTCSFLPRSDDPLFVNIYFNISNSGAHHGTHYNTNKMLKMNLII